MENSCVLRVSGLPLDLGDDELLLDKLTIHFLRRRNGGSGEVAVCYPTEERGTASLAFHLKEVAERVLQRSHRLEINKCTYLLEVKRPQVQVTQLSMPITTILRLELFTDLSEVLTLLRRHNLKSYGVNSGERSFQLCIEGEFQDLSRCRAEIYHLLGKSFSSGPNNGQLPPPALCHDSQRGERGWKLKGAQSPDSSYSGATDADQQSRPPSSSRPDPSASRPRPSPEHGASSRSRYSSAGKRTSSRNSPLTVNARPAPSGMSSQPPLTGTKSTTDRNSLHRKAKGASAEDVSSSPELTKSMERQPTDRSTHNITSKPRKPNNTSAEDISSIPKHPRPPATVSSAPLYNRPPSTSDSNPPSGRPRRPPETLLDKKGSVSTKEQSRTPGGISAVAVGGNPTYSSEMKSQLAVGHHRNPTDVSAQDVNSSQEYLMTTRKERQLREPSTVTMTSNSRDTKDTSAGDLNSRHDYVTSAIRPKEPSAYQVTSSPRKPSDLSGTPTDHSSFKAARGSTSGSPSVNSRTRSPINSNPGPLTEVLVDWDVFRYVNRFDRDEIQNLCRSNVELKTDVCGELLKVTLRAKSADCPELFYKAAGDISKIFNLYQQSLHTFTLSDGFVLTAELETLLTRHRILVSPIENSSTSPATIRLIGPASEVYRSMQMWSAIKRDTARPGAQSQGEEPRWPQGSRVKAKRK